MDEYGKNLFPDDINDWSLRNFNEARQLFERTVNRNAKAFSKKQDEKPVNLPKPSREKVIQKDDVLNLQIMLGQIQTVDDLIKNM